MVVLWPFGNALQAQKFSTDKGEIRITSNAQLELIRASTEKVQGIVDASNNQFAFLLPVSSFHGFNSDLQRQHFNDNYMESETFPKASFSGKIIEHIDFNVDSVYEVRAKGNLDIHGQKQIRIIKGTLTVHNHQLTIDAHFSVPLADHQISIPKIVSQKIATDIEVVFHAVLKPQK